MTLLWQFANTPSQRLVYSGIIVEAMRDRWTDDRMDDLAGRVDTGFAQVHEDIVELRTDNRELRGAMIKLDRDLRIEIGDLRAEIGDLRLESGHLATREELQVRFDALNHRFHSLQRTLIAAILAGFIGLLATHFG